MRCKDQLCDSASGDCVDCVPGNYGLGCNDQCSPGCQDICNTTSGLCQCKEGFIQPIVHYCVQKTAITVTVYKKVDFVHHVYQENMATFVTKTALVIVTVIVSKLQAFVGIVQKENTVFIVTKRVTKIVKVISVTGLLANARTV